MNLREFISFSRTQLLPIIDLNGAILYSSVKTLTSGKYYILGLNPGGSPDSGESIEINLNSLPKYEGNSFLDESWLSENRIGEHPIQKGLSSLCKYINYDLRNICASNLIFYRCRDEKGVDFWKDAEICWPVHEKILKIVNPKVIITIGNGQRSAFRFLCYKNNIPFSNVEKINTNHNGYSFKNFKIGSGNTKNW